MPTTRGNETLIEVREPVTPGEAFGMLTVLDEGERLGGHRSWVCRCSCGTVATIRESDLRRRTRSCGCTGGRPRKDDGIDRGYPRAHARVARQRGSASTHRCIDCWEWADHWSYVRGCAGEQTGPIDPTDNASKSAPFCDHVEHYQPRCRSCHIRLDLARGMTARRLRAAMLNRL